MGLKGRICRLDGSRRLAGVMGRRKESFLGFREGGKVGVCVPFSAYLSTYKDCSVATNSHTYTLSLSFSVCLSVSFGNEN